MRRRKDSKAKAKEERKKEQEPTDTPKLRYVPTKGEILPCV